MSTSSNSNPIIAIIGGGPAGMSCALWSKLIGLYPIIVERKAALGGQLLDIDRINRWVLGMPNLSSSEIAGLYARHIHEENIPVKYHTQLTAIEKLGTNYRLFLLDSPTQSQTAILVQAIVIATGVRVLNHEIFSQIPGFASLAAAGRIFSFPTDHLDKLKYLHGKTVAVIGGGDNAHFTAKDLASTAARTYLLMRSYPKAHSMIRKAVENLIEQELVIEYPETSIDAFGQGQDGIEICLRKSGSVTFNIKVDMVFIRVGFAPNSEFLDSLTPLANIHKQKNGYLFTDSECRTSIPAVYAIGDVTGSKLQSVVTAIADGAKAARTIETDFGGIER